MESGIYRQDAAAREKAKRNPDPELVKGRQILDKLGRGEKLTPAPTLAERLVQNPNISASLRQSAERVIAASKDVPVLKCKNFSELQIYWADNYNVKVADSIKQLHFESVRLAMGGVEKMILEFQPAIVLLNGFDVRREYHTPMCTQYGGRYVGKPNEIYFNPDYFDKAENLKCLIMGTTTGYHPKNTGIFETGAHEMTHILEDWLAYKDGGTYQELNGRIYARKIIQTAYANVKKLSKEKASTIIQLKLEISKYAFEKDISECMAEAVSDYVANGENASILSVEIWKALKEELN